MKRMTGTVVSTKMEKTCIVSVSTRWRHPLYKKMRTVNKRYKVYDNIKVSEGDFVRIEETRPHSRHKRWKVVEVIKKK